ncbi:hypothetical protein [Halobacillus sp. Cin3]|uniref:hypothetical protein n=1 Tax=Halobacillus sp. Cin3 TaxID=2928441 RepID=UPI00248D7566|nr:hypothetical protein [Halobacillus sp. Cin3]
MRRRTEVRTKKEKNRDIGGFVFMILLIAALPHLYETFSIAVNLVLVLFVYGLLMLLITLFSRN